MVKENNAYNIIAFLSKQNLDQYNAHICAYLDENRGEMLRDY